MTDMFASVAKMAGKPLPWSRVSDYAIVRGRQAIAKCFVDGCTLYVLTDGETRIGHYNDAAEAKAMADQVMGAA